jgi:hypothetical protein
MTTWQRRTMAILTLALVVNLFAIWAGAYR